MKELNWQEVWEGMQKQRMRPLKITFEPDADYFAYLILRQ